jgi:hypothetical protein
MSRSRHSIRVEENAFFELPVSTFLIVKETSVRYDNFNIDEEKYDETTGLLVHVHVRRIENI